MHPVEVEQTLETMQICVDTREQPTPRASARYKQFGVPYIRKKLNTGDYSAIFTLPNGELFSLEDKILIERKQNLTELAMCYCQERERFAREFERAKKAESKLYLIVEDANWANIYAGKYRSKMNPKSFVASILSWLSRYNCELIFCTSTVTGWLIHDILWYEAREILLNLGEEDGRI